MMDFPGLPDPAQQFVNEFTYENWPPQTTITLYNVPFDALYRDVINWQTGGVDQRTEYFNSLPSHRIALGNGGRVKPFQPIKIPTPLGVASQYNYLVVSSPATTTGDIPKTYYYFITDMTFLSGNSTNLNLQLDVWTTYCDRVELGNAFVVRGHVGIANENARSEVNGRIAPRLSNRYHTTPEGLDTGSEYYTNKGLFKDFAGEVAPLVMIQSTAKLTGDLGTLDNPSIRTARGGITTNLPNGCAVYYVPGQSIEAFWSYLSNYPWVAQCIVSQQLVPGDRVFWTAPEMVGPVQVLRPISGGRQPRTVNLGVLYDLLGIAEFNVRHPYARNLLKFHTAPYCMLEMTANNGTAAIFKPEHIDVRDEAWGSASIYGYEQYLLVPPAPRIKIGLLDYLSSQTGRITGDSQALDGGTVSSELPGGDEQSNALVIGDFPTFGVANSSAAVAVASTANSRAFQYDTAEWSQSKAMATASNAYNAAGISMTNSQANTGAAISAQNRGTNIQNASTQFQGNMAMINSGVGAIGSLASGNIGGAVQGVVGLATTAANTSNSIAVNNQMNDNSVIMQSEQLYNNLAAGQGLRDSNRGLAEFAAKGDYQNAIAGISAKVRDTLLTPPGIVGGFGGDAMNISNGLWGYFVRCKRISPQSVAVVASVWNRYGYYVQEWMPIQDKLMNMTNFTYWQLQDCSVLSTRMPEMFKQTVRGIFEKGVTLWRTPEIIGRTLPHDNEIVEGVSY